MARLVPATLVTGTPRIGVWCPVCLTPGRILTPLQLVSEIGVTFWRLHISCTTCDRSLT